MKKISNSARQDIFNDLKNGLSCRALVKKYSVGLGTIGRIRQEYGPFEIKNRSGPPNKLSNKVVRRMSRKITSNEIDTAVEAAKILSTEGYKVSDQTVRNEFKKIGLRAVKKKKKPFLKKIHRQKRMEFARRHIEWTIEDWKKVVWTDETKVNRIGNDGNRYVWKTEKCNFSDYTISPTLKFGGGSIMVWGCMFWEGVGFAEKIEGNMNSDKYIDILKVSLVKSFEKYNKNEKEMILQQDNDSKHVSKKTKKYLKESQLQTLIWPPMSPDLNVIEHLWRHVKIKLGEYDKLPSGVHELWERFENIWNAVNKEVCSSLIESMPRRIEALYNAKGGYTKY